MTEKKLIVVVSPIRKDIQTLSAPHFAQRYKFIFHHDSRYDIESYVTGKASTTPPGTLDDFVQDILATYDGADIDGVISSRDYVGNIVASIIADRWQLPGPSPKSVLTCQHKYLARCAQHDLVPEAVPRFSMLTADATEHSASFPCFVKPVKSYFSMFAGLVSTPEQLKAMQQTNIPDPRFLQPLHDALSSYILAAPSVEALLLEDVLTGQQCTLEGYCYQGMVSVIGITDSIMYSGSICFERFEYPSTLPVQLQERMAVITERVMRGLGFDNALFNIEFMVNIPEDTVHIIEINPRGVAQFADLYERVDGTNSYDILLDVCTGRRPVPSKTAGNYAIAASCVLRTFEDQEIIRVPTSADIGGLQQIVPDCLVKVVGRPGELLSDSVQDGTSYLYAEVNLGARDKSDLIDRLAICKQALPFEFKPV